MGGYVNIFKCFTILISFFVFSLAQAEVKNEVSNLSEISFNGKELQVGYQMGGGCATHETRFELELVKLYDPASDYYGNSVFKLKVFDVTPNGDMCEAIMYIEKTIDLKSMIQAEAKKLKIDNYEVDVEFPKASVNLML